MCRLNVGSETRFSLSSTSFAQSTCRLLFVVICSKPPAHSVQSVYSSSATLTRSADESMENYRHWPADSGISQMASGWLFFGLQEAQVGAQVKLQVLAEVQRASQLKELSGELVCSQFMGRRRHCTGTLYSSCRNRAAP